MEKTLTSMCQVRNVKFVKIHNEQNMYVVERWTGWYKNTYKYYSSLLPCLQKFLLTSVKVATRAGVSSFTC